MLEIKWRVSSVNLIKRLALLKIKKKINRPPSPRREMDLQEDRLLPKSQHVIKEVLKIVRRVDQQKKGKVLSLDPWEYLPSIYSLSRGETVAGPYAFFVSPFWKSQTSFSFPLGRIQFQYHGGKPSNFEARRTLNDEVQVLANEDKELFFFTSFHTLFI